MRRNPKKLSKILTIGKKFHSTFSKDEDAKYCDFMCHALSKANEKGLLTFEEYMRGKQHCMKVVNSVSPSKTSLRGALLDRYPEIGCFTTCDLKKLIKLERKVWLETIRNLKAEGN